MTIKYAEKKVDYFKKMEELVAEHSKILIIEVDNIGSKQMAEVRVSLRGKATMLMGKNTMMRKALSLLLPKFPSLENLITAIKLNIGFVFCKSDPSEVRKIILSNQFPEYAKVGVIAPIDVFVPPGPTGMDPGQTSFFQALGIATRIFKSQIEIQNREHLIQAGTKVSASAATLLQKLNIKPFTYGIGVKKVYDDGEVYDAQLLDIAKEDILKFFSNSVKDVTAFGLAVDLPSQATVTHTLTSAFKTTMAVCMGGDYTFPEMKALKDLVTGASKEDDEE